MKVKQRILRALAVVLIIGFSYTHSALKEFSRYGCTTAEDTTTTILKKDTDTTHSMLLSSVTTFVITRIAGLFTSENSQ